MTLRNLITRFLPKYKFKKEGNNGPVFDWITDDSKKKLAV